MFREYDSRASLYLETVTAIRQSGENSMTKALRNPFGLVDVMCQELLI